MLPRAQEPPRCRDRRGEEPGGGGRGPAGRGASCAEEEEEGEGCPCLNMGGEGDPAPPRRLQRPPALVVEPVAGAGASPSASPGARGGGGSVRESQPQKSPELWSSHQEGLATAPGHGDAKDKAPLCPGSGRSCTPPAPGLVLSALGPLRAEGILLARAGGAGPSTEPHSPCPSLGGNDLCNDTRVAARG